VLGQHSGASLTLSRVQSHLCDQSWLVPGEYDHTGVIRTVSASCDQLLHFCIYFFIFLFKLYFTR